MNIKKIIKVLLGIIFAIILLLIAGILFIIILNDETPNHISNLEDYEKCLSLIEHKENISHFPKKLDSNADAILYCYPSYSGELLLLKLKVKDKDSIKSLFKEYKFTNSDTPLSTKQKIYNMPASLVGMEPQNLTYYTLENNGNFKENEEYFPYFTGIGISVDSQYILYYYMNPD